MGKTRDLFKKIRDIKGIFHAKMGSIKDRNGMDLTEAEIQMQLTVLIVLEGPKLSQSEWYLSWA